MEGKCISLSALWQVTSTIVLLLKVCQQVERLQRFKSWLLLRWHLVGLFVFPFWGFWKEKGDFGGWEGKRYEVKSSIQVTHQCKLGNLTLVSSQGNFVPGQVTAEFSAMACTSNAKVIASSWSFACFPDLTVQFIWEFLWIQDRGEKRKFIVWFVSSSRIVFI